MLFDPGRLCYIQQSFKYKNTTDGKTHNSTILSLVKVLSVNYDIERCIIQFPEGDILDVSCFHLIPMRLIDYPKENKRSAL